MLYTGGEANCRGRLTTQFLKQVIVSPSTAKGALSAFCLRQNFKYSPGVVVQAPDQLVVDLKGNLQQAQIFLQSVKVFSALRAEVVHAPRGGVG